MRKRYQSPCSYTVANSNPITDQRYKQYTETPTIPSTKVSQCSIYHEDINIDHQNDIFNPNVNKYVNCAKENIKNSFDLHSSNDSVDFKLTSSSRRRNYKSSNTDSSSHVNNSKSHYVQENRKRQEKVKKGICSR